MADLLRGQVDALYEVGLERSIASPSNQIKVFVSTPQHEPVMFNVTSRGCATGTERR